jgi:hypothetical protein
MVPTSFSTRRLFGWLPAAVFVALSLLFVIGAPDVGGKLFSLAMFLVTTLWLVRCLRVGVATSGDTAIVRTSVWTHRFARSDFSEARVVPMPTMSPFGSRWRYVALGLLIPDGRVRRFSDISAASSRESIITAIVDHLNRWRTESVAP